MLKQQKQLWIVVLCLVIAATVASAEEQVIKITLKQAEGNREIENVLVNLIVVDKESNSERNIPSFIRSNPITLRLEQGEYSLKFQIDDLSTPGKDYYVKQEISLNNPLEQEIIAFPVGSIKGVVYDTLNNLVSEALLKVECSKEYGGQFPEETDRVGSFSLDYAPLGECIITATANRAAGSGRITVEKGQSHTLEIRLDSAVISEGGNSWSIFWSVIILVVIGVAGWFGWNYWQKRAKPTTQQKKAIQESNSIEQNQEEKRSKRTQDIINTLNEKEKKIITFLLNNQHMSTQAKIRYETGIPKTTLVRIFTSLQNKKVITIETVGKLKKIKLTNWFLDKEN